MPKELKDMDYEPDLPQGMTALTLSHDYNVAWAAHESKMTPAAFRLLPWDEQAELMAFHHVRTTIGTFYAEEQRKIADEKLRRAQTKKGARG